MPAGRLLTRLRVGRRRLGKRELPLRPSAWKVAVPLPSNVAPSVESCTVSFCFHAPETTIQRDLPRFFVQRGAWLRIARAFVNSHSRYLAEAASGSAATVSGTVAA